MSSHSILLRKSGFQQPASLPEASAYPARETAAAGRQPEPSDEALMRGIAARDPWALDQLYARHRTLLGKVIAPILSNQADAEETVQDMFTEIWTHADRFDGRRGQPLGWIICMARRRAIDHLRKLRSRAETREKLFPGGEPESGGAMRDDAATTRHLDEVEASDLGRLVQEAIGGLPAAQGRGVHLTYFQAMSQREIARHTGLPPGTIKTRLEFAKSKLLRQLAPLRAELVSF